MKKKRVLVCGASGFIGRNVIERLLCRDDLEIRGTGHTLPDLRSVNRSHPVDLADFLDAKQALQFTEGADVIIQCAAATAGSGMKDHWLEYAEKNIQMNMNLLNAAASTGVKHFIFLSCSVMYPPFFHRPVKEDDVRRNEFHPVYREGALAKLFIEDWCYSYAAQTDMSCTVIRHSNIYGSHDKFDLAHSHVCAALITKAMTSTDGKLHINGDGFEKRDLLYVFDLVDFIEYSTIHPPVGGHATFNIGSGAGISVNDLAKKIVALSGRDLEIVHDLTISTTRPASIVLDSGLVKRFTGWEPKVPLDEGLKKTIEWYRENIGKESK